MSDLLYIAPERWASERILLRSWMPGDGPRLSEAVNCSYEHLLPWMPWAKEEQGVLESEAIVRRFRGRWLLAEDFVIAVLSPDGRRVLGGTGFHLRHGPIAGGVIEVGLWIRADAAGRGLGGHVLGELLRWAWVEWPWRRLVWRCDAHNAVSRRTAERAGFVLEGVLRQDGRTPQGALRDTCLYALMRE